MTRNEQDRIQRANFLVNDFQFVKMSACLVWRRSQIHRTSADEKSRGSISRARVMGCYNNLICAGTEKTSKRNARGISSEREREKETRKKN